MVVTTAQNPPTLFWFQPEKKGLIPTVMSTSHHRRLHHLQHHCQLQYQTTVPAIFQLTAFGNFVFALLQRCCQCIRHATAGTSTCTTSCRRRHATTTTRVAAHLGRASVADRAPVHLLQRANTTRFLYIAQHGCSAALGFGKSWCRRAIVAGRHRRRGGRRSTTASRR